MPLHKELPILVDTAMSLTLKTRPHGHGKKTKELDTRDIKFDTQCDDQTMKMIQSLPNFAYKKIKARVTRFYYLNWHGNQ